MTVTVYTSEDTDAPKLFDQVAGTTTNFWKKILVDGYGTKPGAGWSMPFIDGHIAVFQNAEQDAFYRMDGSDAGRYFYLTTFLSMSDAHTGLDGAINNSLNSGRGQRCELGYLSHHANRDFKWLVIADERTVWIYTYGFSSSTNHTYSAFVAQTSMFGSVDGVFGRLPMVKLSYFTSQTAYSGFNGALSHVDFYCAGLWMSGATLLSVYSNNGYMAYPSTDYSFNKNASVDMVTNFTGDIQLTALQARVTHGQYDNFGGLLLRGGYEVLCDLRTVTTELEDESERIKFFTHQGRPFVRLISKGSSGTGYDCAIVVALDDWGL